MRIVVVVTVMNHACEVEELGSCSTFTRSLIFVLGFLRFEELYSLRNQFKGNQALYNRPWFCFLTGNKTQINFPLKLLI